MYSIAKRLRQALKWGMIVRIRRRKGWDKKDGCVVGLSDDWVLIHRLSDTFVLDGYEVLRTGDIRSIEKMPAAEVAHRALTLRGYAPTPLPELDLTSISPLLASANALYPLITIELETRWSDICFIGIVERLGRKNLWLKKIDPRAKWIETEKFPLRDITQVDFGGGYEQALWMVSEDSSRRIAD